MTGKDLFREIGMIDEKYVEEATMVKKAKILTPMFRKTLVTAACLFVCVGMYFGIQSLNGGSKSANNESAADMMTAESMKDAGMGADGAGAGPAADDSDSFFDGMLDGGLFEEMESVAEGDSACSDAESSVAPNTITQAEENMDMMQSSDAMKTIRERLEQYPADYETICETEAFVVVHGKVKTGLDKWEAFLEATGDGKPASVDIVQFTEEGDPIITCLSHDGTSYMVVVDSTRDNWGSGNVWQEEFECLKVSEKQDGSVEVILGDVVDFELESGKQELTNIYHLVIFKAEE